MVDSVGTKRRLKRRDLSFPPAAGGALRSSFPVGENGTLFQTHENSRHHVIRQGSGKHRSQFFPTRDLRPRNIHMVGDEVCLSAYITSGHDALSDGRHQPQDRGLNLAWLYAVSADLHLLIRPPEKFYLPVGTPTEQDRRCGTSVSPAGPKGQSTKRSAVSFARVKVASGEPPRQRYKVPRDCRR